MTARGIPVAVAGDWLRRGVSVLLALGIGLAPGAWAASSIVSGSVPLTTSVNLDFALQIDKFMFLRIGDGQRPNPGGSVSNVAFTLSPSIPAVPTSPAPGSNAAVNWSGAAPGFSASASGQVLPVEVRSNAGQVRLYATVGTPLSSGGNTIAMSDVTISSDQPTLPAPPLPASGTGPSVNVTGGGPGALNSLVTLRQANWTFALSTTNATSYAAGQYSGQVTFTASAP